MTPSDHISGAPLSRRTLESPVGVLTIEASAHGVRTVTWANHSTDDAVPASGGPTADAVAAVAVQQLGEYFEGHRRQFDVPLDPIGTPFQQATWEVLRTIPFGTTITYGEQARRLGDARKSRAVGAANGRNPIGIIVPCHRVVGADGSLTGFAGGLDAKAWLLRHEDAPVMSSHDPQPTLDFDVT